MRHIPKHERLYEGQERIISKFLLLPKKLGKEIRWLERATIRQKVVAVDVGGSDEWGKFKNMWCNVEFINKQEWITMNKTAYLTKEQANAIEWLKEKRFSLDVILKSYYNEGFENTPIAALDLVSAEDIAIALINDYKIINFN